MAPPTKAVKDLKNDNDVPRLSLKPESLQHPKLRGLAKSRRRLGTLLRQFTAEPVERALLQADLQYGRHDGIRNAYALIYALCRDGLDDGLLRAAEARRRREDDRWRCRSCRRQVTGLTEGLCWDCYQRACDEEDKCADCRPRKVTLRQRVTDLLLPLLIAVNQLDALLDLGVGVLLAVQGIEA